MGAKFTPRGKLHPLGQTLVVKICPVFSLSRINHSLEQHNKIHIVIKKDLIQNDNFIVLVFAQSTSSHFQPTSAWIRTFFNFFQISTD
jgi:hypothetical protein